MYMCACTRHQEAQKGSCSGARITPNLTPGAPYTRNATRLRPYCTSDLGVQCCPEGPSTQYVKLWVPKKIIIHIHIYVYMYIWYMYNIPLKMLGVRNPEHWVLGPSELSQTHDAVACCSQAGRLYVTIWMLTRGQPGEILDTKGSWDA